MNLSLIKGAKKFRKRSLVERLKTENSVVKMMNSELVQRLQFALKTLKEFEKEDNWAVKEENIVWTGEGEPNEIAKAALARLRKANHEVKREDAQEEEKCESTEKKID